MLSQAPYSVVDIDGISLSIDLTKSPEDALHNAIKDLEISKFTRSTVQTTTILQKIIEKAAPLLVLTGKHFQISITSKNIILSFLEPIGELIQVRVSDDEKNTIDKNFIFSKENLNSVESDFNFVSGVILGRIGMRLDDLTTSFKFSATKVGKLKNDFAHIVSPESKLLFGKISDFHIQSLAFSTEEEMFGDKVKVDYSIDGRTGALGEDEVNSSMYIKLKRVGSLSIHNILEDSLNRLNKLVMSLGGDIVEEKTN